MEGKPNICATCGRERPHRSLLTEKGWLVVARSTVHPKVTVTVPSHRIGQEKVELVCSQGCAVKTVSKILNQIKEDARGNLL